MAFNQLKVHPLSKFWFQMCQPAPLQPGWGGAAERGDALPVRRPSRVVGRARGVGPAARGDPHQHGARSSKKKENDPTKYKNDSLRWKKITQLQRARLGAGSQKGVEANTCISKHICQMGWDPSMSRYSVQRAYALKCAFCVAFAYALKSHSCLL